MNILIDTNIVIPLEPSSHVDIGIKILEKFGVEKEVINAMKSHHEEYPYEALEAVIVQVADQISGARPGARKDTVENYLKRLNLKRKTKSKGRMAVSAPPGRF